MPVHSVFGVTPARSCGRMFLLLMGFLLTACVASPPAERLTVGPRLPVPEQIQGLSYEQLEALSALTGSCADLAQLHREGVAIWEGLYQELMDACNVQVTAALERQAMALRQWEQEATEAMLAEELEQRQAQAAQRELALRQRQEQLARQREAQRRLELQRELAAQRLQARRAALAQRISQTQAQQALRAQADKPVAFLAGQHRTLPLKSFLACVELAYPNQGYRVDLSGRTLTVVAQEARLPRGDLPIEYRFTEYADYWRLTYLRVADIEARTDEDRQALAQNLVADACPPQQELGVWHASSAF